MALGPRGLAEGLTSDLVKEEEEKEEGYTEMLR